MNKVLSLEAVGFGFRMLFKKFFFFLGVFFVGLFILFAGLIASLIVAIPFLFPLFRMSSKLFSLIGNFRQGFDAPAILIQLKDFFSYLFSSGIWVVIGLWLINYGMRLRGLPPLTLVLKAWWISFKGFR